MAFPARTRDGESVTIVQKSNRANESSIMLADDGRVFEVDPAGTASSLREVADEYLAEAREILEREAAEARVAAGELVDEARGEVEGDAIPTIAASLDEAKDEITEAVSTAADAVGDSVSEAADEIRDEVVETAGELRDMAADKLDGLLGSDEDEA